MKDTGTFRGVKGVMYNPSTKKAMVRSKNMNSAMGILQTMMAADLGNTGYLGKHDEISIDEVLLNDVYKRVNMMRGAERFEHFGGNDQPWYAGTYYADNEPGKIALGEDSDAAFYRIHDRAAEPPKKVVVKTEYFNPKAPISLAKATKMLQPALPNSELATHLSRFESFNSPLTVMHAAAMFKMKQPVPASKLKQPLRAKEMFMWFKPKPSVSVKLMRSGKTSESYTTSGPDPRFAPYNALVNYQVGSDTVDIDRVYGTAGQRIDYPKFTKLIDYNI
jgi:hypothetical protein